MISTLELNGGEYIALDAMEITSIPKITILKDDFAAVTDHELGHEIDKLLNASSDFEIREMYSEMMQAGTARDVLSQYSATNVQEFIAESYSEFRNNPSPRELSTRVYNRLIELRDQKIYRKGLVR